jgi:glycosyltransferase involved in cell wall biosynthesis
MNAATGRRVALFVSSMQGGGAQRTMLKLANGIAARGYAVDLVLARAEGPYLNEVDPRVRILDLAASRVLLSLPGLIRYLRRERPGAMVSALNYVNIVALWARALARVPTRLVISERNTISLSAQRSARRRERWVGRLAGVFYRWADAVVAVSSGVGDDLARVTKLPPGRIRVIYNPVVTPELAERARMPLDHPWFQDGEPPVVLGVGRLTEQKDFSTLIRAFARIRARREARLLILGDGPLRAQLQELAGSLGLGGEASLPGFEPNPYAYMSRASVFVLSSRWEGLPGALIEALYCGPRVVATDCPSGPREILAAGNYGQLVPVGDDAAMAEAIERALEGRVPRPSPESWAPFELGRVVDQYLRLIWGPEREQRAAG